MTSSATQTNATSAARTSAQATVIATLPPPTTGMTRVTERMVNELAAHGDVRVINLSEGEAARGRGWKIVRSLRQVRASFQIAAGRAGHGNIYIALNSGTAVLLDVLLVGAARLRGRRVFMHHHSFRFIDAPSPFLRALYRVGGTRVTDIVLCERMAAGLRAGYGRDNSRVVPNLVDATEDTSVLEPRADGPLKLGHLSNLSIEKGVGRAIDAFEHVRAAGIEAELHIAGPFADDRAREAVERAVAAWPGGVVHHGPVYGAAKDAFYQSLDLFLYPTAYVVEAQPLVLLEALGAGVAVVSVDRGCVGGLADIAVGDSVTISELDAFAETVTAIARRAAADAGAEQAARQDAISTARVFATDAREAFAAIRDEILGDG